MQNEKKLNAATHANGRIESYEKVRVWATILVLIGHALSLELPHANGSVNIYVSMISFTPSFFELLWELIYSFHMPLFVMLSGAVFALTYRNRPPVVWLKKRFAKLLIPYLFTALLLMVPTRLLIDYYADSANVLESIFYDIFLGYDPDYLWYVLMLAEVSVVAILLKRWILSDKLKTTLILTGALLVLSAGSLPIGTLPLQLDRAGRFLFWFYMGVLLERDRERFVMLSTWKHLIWLCLMWICAFSLHSYFEVIIMRGVLSGLPLAALKCVKMGVRYIMEGGGALMCFMLANLSLHNMGKAFKWIGKHSFQVYLFHSPFIWLYRYIV